MHKKNYLFLFFVLCTFVFSHTYGQQKKDEKYIEKIREFTTDSIYINEIITNFPASDDVPTPMDFFGSVIGADGVLHYTQEIYDYFDELVKKSPRVKVESLGTTEQGKEMRVYFISNSETLEALNEYKGYLNQLSDPRKTPKKAAEQVIEKAKPLYYITAGIHSPETGNPEAVMELAYRLVVSEDPEIQEIRDRLIVGITPVVEVDGRDRAVDIYKWRDANNGVTPELTFWGDYVAHDNNRDSYALALKLTNNLLDFYLEWKPTVIHDLHESVPFLYISTGMGPYNPYFDATMVDEWNKLAYNDMDELTRRGMPGVWTWGFFNNWGLNYMMSLGVARNSVGRFYETFGNAIPHTVERKIPESASSQEWFRPNPPLAKTKWSMRNNANYSQTGVLASLTYTAEHTHTFLSNFYRRSQKSMELGGTKTPYAKGKTPYAYVIPKDQKRNITTVQLVNYFRRNAVEVYQTDQALSIGDKAVAKGAYIIKTDQPYSVFAINLLERQNFPIDKYKPPYDDVGWTISDLQQVQTYRVEEADFLPANEKKMSLLTEDVALKGSVNKASDYLLLNNNSENEVAVFRLQLADIPMEVAEEEFTSDNRTYAAGSLVVERKSLSQSQRERLKEKAEDLGLALYGVKNKPNVDTHQANMPRIALLYTWVPTPQNAGWWKYWFDQMGVPYDLVFTQDVKRIAADQYDVMILPDTRADLNTLINGKGDSGPKVPWKTTALTPNLGKIASTEDQREGLGYEGLNTLRQFLDRGGVLITDAGSSKFPIEFGFTKNVSVKNTKGLQANGSVFSSTVTDPKSPIAYGLNDSLPVYFSQAPVLQANTKLDGPYGDRSYLDPEWLQQEKWKKDFPRVIVKFDKDPSKLLLSGMLKNGEELAGTPAVIDAPVGKGHVVMFAIHPFWRASNYVSQALVFNTILNWDALDTQWPELSKEE